MLLLLSLLGLAACAPEGPDVSHYQGTIDWGQVKAAGASFAMAKATEGNSYKDPTFHTNWVGMKSAGIKVRGAYHFGRPADTAQSQADLFVAAIGTMAAGDFTVLDIEQSDSQSPATVAAFSAEFCKLVKAKTGRPVFVYTGAWFWNPSAGGSAR